MSNTGFTVNTGNRRIDVSVAGTENNPLDDEGFQQVEEGDRVSVTGQVGGDFMQGRQLVAEVVTTVTD